MKSWKEIENYADINGFIPEIIYNKNVRHFEICSVKNQEVIKNEAEIWNTYLSVKRKLCKNRSMYSEMYRYEWYEGKKRTGFWGNIEHAINQLQFKQAPKITIFSAGIGRDLLKVGLAAGVWESTAPSNIKGTYKEIDPQYFKLLKPDARIMVTEYDDNNIDVLKKTVAQLNEKKLLSEMMVSIRKWDFRKPSPVATASQNLVVFALTGNYASIDEQPFILAEIAKCIKVDGYFIASTMTSDFSFKKARSFMNKLKLFFNTPLAWPIALEFCFWQNGWSKMAADMNEKGFWENVPAKTWAEFLKPYGMKTVKIYPTPSKIIPVEVLVSKKVGGGKIVQQTRRRRLSRCE